MRVCNFSAGPGCLPLPVLEKIRNEMVEHEDHGMSVMEMSHRTQMFYDIFYPAQDLLKKIMNIPDNYKILFLTGGATTQNSMIPMNLMKNKKADYVNTGVWSEKSIKEAKRFGDIKVVASSEDRMYNYIPTLDASTFRPDADYFHITTNNTIYGTRYTQLPNTGNVPLVADMSSNIMSETGPLMDVQNFGLIYAGAQKNIGPSGVTVVIVREDLIGNALPFTPDMMDYSVHVKANYIYNTPPTFAIYVVKLCLEWLQEQGGIAGIEKVNNYKAGILYDFLDNSKLFIPSAEKESRSLMNITCTLSTKDLEAKFIKEAGENGFVNLKGYKTVGGLRISMYNAQPAENVEKLVEFMKKFELQNK
jgi:phosphoserine aminotransferase